MVRLFLMVLLCTSVVSVLAQTGDDTSMSFLHGEGLYAVVISKGGKVTYEKYLDGHSSKDLFNNQSLTKSIVSLLIGIAIDRGIIPSIDEPIVHYFPSLNQDPDPRKRQIRIRDIMNQASGLWHEALDSPNGLNRFLQLPDPSGYVLAQPLLTDPGQVFHYNNAATHLLSLILTKSTGIRTSAFAQQYLFGPLGIDSVQWDRMKDGYDDGSGLLSIHTRTSDLNRIGNLILDRGIYQGNRLVSADWIDAILHPVQTYPSPWGLHPSRYALCFYHYTFEGKELIYGLGWGGQFLILRPDDDVVITVNQDPTSPRAVDHSVYFLSVLFPLIWKTL
jgi:CubicO group peptidase (beta-lactamase class C family)